MKDTKNVILVQGLNIKRRMKILIAILLLFNCLFVKAQESNNKWDPYSCVYSDFYHGVSWSFPSDITWDLTSGTEKHTIFKVVQPETQVTAFINANKIEDANINDIWKVYDYIVAQSKEIDRQIEANTGEKIISHTFQKCIFCGKHAYKTFYQSSFIDDRYDSPIEMVSMSYCYAWNGYSYSVTVKSYKLIYDEAGEEAIQDLFKGFTIINRYEK